MRPIYGLKRLTFTFFGLMVLNVATLANDVDSVETIQESVLGVTPEDDEFNQLKQASQSRIEEVLADSDFNATEEITRWRLKGGTEESTREELLPEWMIRVLEFMESLAPFFKSIAGLIEVIMWALVIGVIAYVAVNYRRSIAKWIGRRDTKKQSELLPTSMFGLDVRQESLPDNLLQLVRKSWYEDNKRESIALLFRATLTVLIHEYGCRFKSSDTEMECYHRVQNLVQSHQQELTQEFLKAKPGLEHFMFDLVTSWQSIAYAHKPPEEASFEQLCEHWEQVL